MDHNERNQSIDDIDSAEIIQIVDHHRVANVSTSSPIYFRNEPVGSTATIVSKMFLKMESNLLVKLPDFYVRQLYPTLYYLDLLLQQKLTSMY